MVCRHAADDPSCSSHPRNVAIAAASAERESERAATTASPDAKSYEIVQVRRVGTHLVMKVLYPNCARCAYEGNKVMVFLDVSEVDALRWRVIDPHFRAPKGTVTNVREAPSPAARFPASNEGWNDAIEYAERKYNVARSPVRMGE